MNFQEIDVPTEIAEGAAKTAEQPQQTEAPAFKEIEPLTHQELEQIVTELSQPDYTFPPFDTKEELQKYLESEAAPIRIQVLPRERVATIPSPEGLGNAVVAALEQSPWVDDDMRANARAFINDIVAYPREGHVVRDQFGGDTDHELRGVWRHRLEAVYGHLFEDIYSDTNQMRSSNKSKVTSGVSMLSMMLADTIGAEENQERFSNALEELQSEAEELMGGAALSG